MNDSDLPKPYCYHCGQPVEEGSSLCLVCGKELDWSNAPSATGPTSQASPRCDRSDFSPPQFSLRSLLVLVVLASMVFAWLGSKLRHSWKNQELAAQIRKVEADIARLGGSVSIAHRDRPSRLETALGDPGVLYVQSIDVGGTNFADTDMVQLAGLTGLEYLYLNETAVSDLGLLHVEQLTGLRRLQLADTKVSDAGLEHLKKLDTLESLYLDRCRRVTDVGLEHLAGLTNLRCLRLNDTRISDDGLKHLRGLAKLEVLMLLFTNVTDDGLEQLKGLTSLRKLDARCKGVTDEGVKRLQEALPRCKITRW